MSLLRIRVGSLNTAKLEAVRMGLAPFFDTLEVRGFEAASGVSDQPLGFDEILSGARARAVQSFDAGEVDLGAGIEDGLIPVPGTRSGHLNVGFCVLYDGNEESIGLSAGFEYPPDCVRAATASHRVPVGEAFDAIFTCPEGLADPGSGGGNIGRLTGGALKRSDYGAQAVTCAFVRRLHPALYGEERK